MLFGCACPSHSLIGATVTELARFRERAYATGSHDALRVSHCAICQRGVWSHLSHKLSALAVRRASGRRAARICKSGMGRPSPSLQQIAWIASVAFSLLVVTCRHGPQAEAPFPSTFPSRWGLPGLPSLVPGGCQCSRLGGHWHLNSMLHFLADIRPGVFHQTRTGLASDLRVGVA